MLDNTKLMITRMWVFGVSAVHQVVMMTYLHFIDYSKAEDPRLWFYNYNKFNLITAWFNIILLAYYPLCFYCDWRTLRHEGHVTHVQTLNKIRDFAFISLLFPAIMFADTLFWRLWLYDRELLCPATVDAVIPYWAQHSMHTFSLIIILFELILVPRERPTDDTVHRRVTFYFICFYLFVCYVNWMFGVNVYALISVLSNPQLALLCAWIVLETMLWYRAQWYLTDWVWGKNKID